MYRKFLYSRVIRIYKVTIDTILKVQNLRKIFYSLLTFIFLMQLPVNSEEKEVKVYSGRHYNTDRVI